MKTITYRTCGTCSREIRFGGCNGNLKGIAALVEGMDKDQVSKVLEGIKCGPKNTSCPDQLSKAMKSI